MHRLKQLTACHIFLVIVAFQQRKFTGSLVAQEVPPMIRVVLYDVLFPDIMRKDQISSEIIAADIHGIMVTVCQREIF